MVYAFIFSAPGWWYGCIGCETSLQICKGVCFEEWTYCKYKCSLLSIFLQDTNSIICKAYCWGCNFLSVRDLNTMWDASLILSFFFFFGVCVSVDPWDGHLQVSWALHVWSRKHLQDTWRDIWHKTSKIVAFSFWKEILLECYIIFLCISSQERDPIERVRKLLLAHDIAAEKELKVILYYILLYMISNSPCLSFDFYYI